MSVRHDRVSYWLVGLFLLLIICAVYFAIAPHMQPRVSLRLGDGVYKARVAQTNEEIVRGLSGVKALSETDAMLFIFERSDTWGMWMKDMDIPIDIIWLNDQREVVYIVKYAAPEDYPKTYRPKEPARYVLEVQAGSVDDKGIAIGDEASFDLAQTEGLW